jgi:hypothetical protein
MGNGFLQIRPSIVPGTCSVALAPTRTQLPLFSAKNESALGGTLHSSKIKGSAGNKHAFSRLIAIHQLKCVERFMIKQIRKCYPRNHVLINEITIRIMIAAATKANGQGAPISPA